MAIAVALQALLVVTARPLDAADLETALASASIGEVAEALQGHPEAARKVAQDTELARRVISLLKAERERSFAAGHTDENYPERLAMLYRSFAADLTYEAQLLADLAKRLLLEWAQEVLIANGSRSDFARIKRLLEPTELSVNQLGVFDKPGPHIPAANLRAASQRLWKNYGYADHDEYIYSYLSQGGGWLSTEELLLKPNRTLAARYVLDSEYLRRVPLAGAIAFLERGGEVEMVRDVQQMRSKLPLEAAKLCSFPTYGIEQVHLIVIAQVLRVTQPLPPFAKIALEGDRGVADE